MALVFLFLCSCGKMQELQGTLKDLQTTTVQLATTFGFNGISVNLMNGEILQIAAINSPWQTLSPPEKNTKALAMARLAYETYPSRAAIQWVNVSFVTSGSYVGIVHYSNTTDSFRYPKDELAVKTVVKK
jgi:surface antigen